MGSRHETTKLLKEGIPLNEIARLRERSISTIIQHVRMQVGEGQVRPIDVILAFTGERGQTLDHLFIQHKKHTFGTFEKHAVNQGFGREEVRLYYDVRQSGGLRGDIYVLISDIEIGLHLFIKDALLRQFGSEEHEWWRQGIPDSVRKDCVRLREEDATPTEAYRYTTFIHLSDIIDQNWLLFQDIFCGREIAKKQLMQNLRDLNILRNTVMHPVKQKSWTREHLETLQHWHRVVQSIRSVQGSSFEERRKPNRAQKWDEGTPKAPASLLASTVTSTG